MSTPVDGFGSTSLPWLQVEADPLDWLLSRSAAVRCTSSTDPPPCRLTCNRPQPTKLRRIFPPVLLARVVEDKVCRAKVVWPEAPASLPTGSSTARLTTQLKFDIIDGAPRPARTPPPPTSSSTSCCGGGGVGSDGDSARTASGQQSGRGNSTRRRERGTARLPKGVVTTFKNGVVPY